MVRQEDIIKTLIFLDIFDYPPTAMELWRFLGVRAELGEVIDSCHPREGGDPESEVTKLGSRGACPREGGGGNDSAFYFLPGREALVEKRREFVYLSEKKFKIAKRAAGILKFIPSIKMIALCNNFYYSEESDIDFLIITRPARLWLTRFFATIILDILHLRARGKKTADRICLSFYISENNLNLEDVALSAEIDPSSGTRDDKKNIETDPCLPEAGLTHPVRAARPPLSRGDLDPSRGAQDDKNDPCLACWLAFMEPIYGYDTYEKFWQANNLPDSWFKKIFPNAELRCPPQSRRVRDNMFSIIFKKIIGVFFLGDLGNLLEKTVENIQRLKLSARVKELAAQDNTNVVLDERMLKFHEEDDRVNFREKLEKNYKLGIINYK